MVVPANRLVGVGYRRPLASWLESHEQDVDCLELTAEHFFDGGHALIKRLAAKFPLYVHGLGLSLGSPDGLEETTLEQFAQVVEVANPQWVSEHVAFTRTAEVDLGHLNPVVPDDRSLDVLTANVERLAERCGKPVLLENVTTHLRISGQYSETEFLNRLCERSGCRLLLDVTNLFINSRNHRFDAVAWLRELHADFIRQLHIVGYSRADGHWHDYHCEPIQEDLWQLYREVVAYAPVESVIVERDGKFENLDSLRDDLRRLANP